ncbi:hypothetical protein, partial [Vibrio cidicii]|uniref:hypothetical protein n=1 Tax=Vibrio cidicii TaxID=1763883 RepID=UPI001C30938A
NSMSSLENLISKLEVKRFKWLHIVLFLLYETIMKARQCPKCQKNVALSWFLFSSHWTKYRCINCGALMKWNRKRAYLGAIIGGLSGPFVISTKSILPSPFLRVAIAVCLALLIAVSVNKQIDYVDETES